MENFKPIPTAKKPDWLKSKIPTGTTFFGIKRDLRKKGLFTVCEEAKCPNIDSCWNSGTATLMILGDTCTRACRFCHIKTGDPAGLLDPKEPEKMADSVRIMGLDYVVLTMVDRDDLPDGGASHIAKVIAEIRSVNPETKVEILGGDFNESELALERIVSASPEVFAHNIETIERLSPRVRDARANYQKSLRVLKAVKELARYKIFTKSALMLGLGEEFEEVEKSLLDLRKHDVDFVTIGQYMRPTKKHLSIKKWVHPSEFERVKERALELGFLGVASSPLVRSSYRAKEFFESATRNL
ncbi:lipoyl synthase [Oligoflexaceae bacterium]|nr:lipoyl synthase [Oligoflexaceae bacterium]